MELIIAAGALIVIGFLFLIIFIFAGMVVTFIGWLVAVVIYLFVRLFKSEENI